MVGSILEANLPQSFVIDMEIEEGANSSEEFDRLHKSHALQAQVSQTTAREDTSEKYTTIYMGKIKGKYIDYVTLMIQKLEQNKVTFNSGMVGVIDSFDAANHNITDTGGTSVISYSSQVFSADTISQGYTTSKSLNILTWQQVQGKESSNVVFPYILEHYSNKKELQDRVFIKDNFKLNLYDMHDRKMLYMLTQYSLYKRKYNFFYFVIADAVEVLRCMSPINAKSSIMKSKSTYTIDRQCATV